MEIFENGNIYHRQENCKYSHWHVFHSLNGIMQCRSCEKTLPKDGILFPFSNPDMIGRILAFPRKGYWYIWVEEAAGSAIHKVNSNDDLKHVTRAKLFEVTNDINEKIMEFRGYVLREAGKIITVKYTTGIHNAMNNLVNIQDQKMKRRA